MASEADRLRLELRASRVECAELRSRLEAGPAGIERARYGVGGEREAELAQRVEELTRELEAERQEAERARRFHEDELTMLLASNKDKEAVWTRKEMELEQELRELRDQLGDARRGHALGGQLQALEDRLADAREALSLAEAFAEEQRVVREEADARVRAQEAEVEMLQARIEDMAEQAEEDEEEMAALEEDLARAIKRVEELGLRSAAMTIEMEQVQEELRRERELLRSTETVAEAEWLRRVAAERANAALQRDVERAQLDADELWSALEAFRAEGAGVAEQLREQMEAAVREAAERERAHHAAMARVDEEVERLAEEAEAAAEREELAAQLIDRLKDHNALLARQLAAMAKRAGAGAGGAAHAVGESGTEAEEDNFAFEASGKAARGGQGVEGSGEGESEGESVGESGDAESVSQSYEEGEASPLLQAQTRRQGGGLNNFETGSMAGSSVTGSSVLGSTIGGQRTGWQGPGEGAGKMGADYRVAGGNERMGGAYGLAGGGIEGESPSGLAGTSPTLTFTPPPQHSPLHHQYPYQQQPSCMAGGNEEDEEDEEDELGEEGAEEEEEEGLATDSEFSFSVPVPRSGAWRAAKEIASLYYTAGGAGDEDLEREEEEAEFALLQEENERLAEEVARLQEQVGKSRKLVGNYEKMRRRIMQLRVCLELTRKVVEVKDRAMEMAMDRARRAETRLREMEAQLMEQRQAAAASAAAAAAAAATATVAGGGAAGAAETSSAGGGKGGAAEISSSGAGGASTSEAVGSRTQGGVGRGEEEGQSDEEELKEEGDEIAEMTGRKQRGSTKRRGRGERGDRGESCASSTTDRSDSHLLLSGATPIASSGALQARAAVGLKELQANRDALRIAMRGVRERAALAAEAQQRAAGGQGRRGKAGRKAEAGAVGEMLAEVEEEVVEGQSLVERAERIVARMAALESKGAGVGKKMEGKRKRLAELEARLGLAPRRVADLLCAIQAPVPAFSSASQRIDSAPPQHLSADASSATPAEGSDGARSAPLAACESGDEEDDPILARRETDRAPNRARSAPDGEPIRSDADGGGEAANAVDGGCKQRPPPESVGEYGGPSGPEPTRYGDWEKGGRCIDF
ncbi:unnamed protein product [Closterium sp. NIES-64]|nr:unnamed protein product [Closterium sp. NIES-64]